jgi:hypothetical protein
MKNLKSTSIDIIDLSNKDKLDAYETLKSWGYYNSRLDENIYVFGEYALDMITAFWINSEGNLSYKLYDFQTKPHRYKYIRWIDYQKHK